MISSISLCLIFSSSLGSLSFNGSSSLCVSLLVKLGEEGGLLLGPWVELEHLSLVGEWVLLILVMNSDGSSYFSELGLNLVRVNDSSDISASHDWSVEGPVGFLVRWGFVGSENGIESLEGVLGENEESSEMSTWGKLEDVESMDVASVNTWQVSSGSLQFVVSLVVDDQWSLSQDVSGVSQFTLTGSGVSGFSNLGKIIRDTE